MKWAKLQWLWNGATRGVDGGRAIDIEAADAQTRSQSSQDAEVQHEGLELVFLAHNTHLANHSQTGESCAHIRFSYVPATSSKHGTWIDDYLLHR